MGYFITIREIDEIFLDNNNKAIILCTDYKCIKNKFKDYRIINLGITLSERLIRYPVEERSSILIRELDNIILNSLENRLFIKDIGILFNPEYRIDILKYFYNIARVKKLVIHWSGSISEEYLEYAESGYLDYRRYSISKYDIICVK